jgi:hypothetical protein
MHHAMMQEMFGGLTPKEVLEKHIDPFDRGAALREPIFYGGESAYSFQYRDCRRESMPPTMAGSNPTKGFRSKPREMLSRRWVGSTLKS